MEADDLKKNSENYRKISKICVNVEYENSILLELSLTPNLAILILETRFPNMKDFSIPLMSQTNRFYPHEKSSELGILSVNVSFVCLFVFRTKNVQNSHCQFSDFMLTFIFCHFS